ncbi:kynureninase [Streptomyces purpurogeneiscleroticus]|uniref:kynureninase n=1 Tax=Streptomyces purpurogeneiscleroticus TaxID=68259 RepID=UPI001CBACC6F|nr:kynureninase [Streptomyces purpurogeneiscleroticus]MBZ4019736.1 kynureninase [Streptomyces purpurogeneiscleroticus]
MTDEEAGSEWLLTTERCGAVRAEGDNEVQGNESADAGVSTERIDTSAAGGALAARAVAAAGVRDDLAARAAQLDAEDPLSGKRAEFVLDEAVYLDGNSLGALPQPVPERVREVVAREWGELRIRSWSESGWWTAPERIGDRIAPLLGAAPGQVVVGDSTSVNVFKALVAAVRMADETGPAVDGVPRDEILVDAATFPTDGYIAQSVARLTGRTLRPVEAGRIPAEVSDRTAAALVNHVDYRSGRLNDLPGITAALHAAGALAVWDLCHSAGALPVGLDAHGVDLAVGCTYKYLNGGPGAPAYLYVRAEHQPRFDSPLPGWNSHANPFGMDPEYVPAAGIERARVGTPDILSLLALEAALEVWEGVAIEDVRAKSLALSDFFLECVRAYVPRGRVRSVTPEPHDERGSQVALECAGAGEVMGELIRHGVIGDFRHPDVLRFGFTPLYTSFADAERAARVLAEVVAYVPGDGTASAVAAGAAEQGPTTM